MLKTVGTFVVHIIIGQNSVLPRCGLDYPSPDAVIDAARDSSVLYTLLNFPVRNGMGNYVRVFPCARQCSQGGLEYLLVARKL